VSAPEWRWLRRWWRSLACRSPRASTPARARPAAAWADAAWAGREATNCPTPYATTPCLADFQAGRFARADNEFGHSLQADPGNADTLYMRGKAKIGEGDLKGAEKFYDKALRVDSLKIPALRESALTLAKLGQTDKAQARFAVLKASSDACGATCSQASALKDAVAVVQAALGPTPNAAN
jgi:tetratricopeptide (TPR) repeat protein